MYFFRIVGTLHIKFNKLFPIFIEEFEKKPFTFFQNASFVNQLC